MLASAVYGRKELLERGELGLPVMAYARLGDTLYVPTEMLAWASQSGPEWFLFPYFVDCVVDSIVPEASGRDGLMVTAMIVATLTSLAERRPVKIAEVLAAATP